VWYIDILKKGVCLFIHICLCTWQNLDEMYSWYFKNILQYNLFI